MRQCLSRFFETRIDGQLPALLFLTSRGSVLSPSNSGNASCSARSIKHARAISLKSEFPYPYKHKNPTSQIVCLPVTREWQRPVNKRYPSSSQRTYASFQSLNAVLHMIRIKQATFPNRTLHIRYSVLSRRSQPILDSAGHNRSIVSTGCDYSIDRRLEENVIAGTHIQKDKDEGSPKLAEVKPPSNIEWQNLEGTKDTLHEFGNDQSQVIRNEPQNIEDVRCSKDKCFSVRRDTRTRGHIAPTRYSQSKLIRRITVGDHGLEHTVRKRLLVGASCILQIREQLVNCQIICAPGSIPKTRSLRNRHVVDLETGSERERSSNQPISLRGNDLGKIKSNRILPEALYRPHKRHMLRYGPGWDDKLPPTWPKVLSFSVDLPVEELKTIAPRYTIGYKHEHWEIAIPWLLNYDLLATLKLLYATANHETQPISCVANALNFVAQQILDQKVVAKDSSICSLYLDVLRIALVSNKNKFAKIISSDQYNMIFAVLAKHFKADMIDTILHVDDAKLTLSPHSYLRLSYTMAEERRPMRALELLHEAKSAGASVASNAFINVGRKILLQYKNDNDEIQNTSTIMSALMDLGLELDVTMYNILLRNSKNMKDFATTKEIYRTMCTGNIDPDEYSYAVLLQMCRHSGDRAFFGELLLRLSGEHRDRVNSFIAWELLRSDYHLTDSKNLTDHKYYEQLIEMYEQFYDVSPIMKLQLLPDDYRPNSTADGHKLSPCSKVTNFLLRARLRLLKRRAPGRFVSLYYLFRDLLRKGDADAIVAVTTSTYNIFLKAFGPLLFRDDLWIRILMDMSKSIDTTPTESDPPLQHIVRRMTRPNQYTWNILLNAFAHNHQMSLAEELFVALRAAGFKPDHMTWHSLLVGYAYAQELEKCAAVLQELSILDFSSNKFTIKALRYLKDKAQLAALLEEGQDWRPRITSLASRQETLSDEEKRIQSDVQKVMEIRMK